MSGNIESKRCRGHFLWVITVTVFVFAVVSSLGFTQDVLGLIPVSSNDHAKGLSGEWTMEGLQISVNQRGQQVTGKVLKLSKNLENSGYRSGDLIIRGELRGKTIQAEWLIPTSDRVRQKCPNHWKRWETLEVRLSENFRGMSGGFQYRNFKGKSPNEILCEEDINSNQTFPIFFTKKQLPQTQKKLGAEVFLRLEVDNPGLIAKPDQPVGVSIHLVDSKGNAVNADQDITLNLKSTLGEITPSPFTLMACSLLLFD